MFVSPFERYKRVMPMVAAQEEQERKLEAKQEAERHREAVDEAEETAMSIQRVHEHFKNVAQTSNVPENAIESRNDKIQVPLSQMHGRKRKRQSDLVDSSDYPEDSKCDVSTPKPSIEVTITQSYARKRKAETTDHPRPCKEMKHDPTMKIPNKGKNNQNNQVFPKNETSTGSQETIKRLNAFSNSK